MMVADILSLASIQTSKQATMSTVPITILLHCNLHRLYGRAPPAGITITSILSLGVFVCVSLIVWLSVVFAYNLK